MLVQLLRKTSFHSLIWNARLFTSFMLLLAVATQATTVAAQTDRLTLIYVSEMTEMDSEEKGSYPKLASLLDHYRQTNNSVVFIAGGGGLAPSAMSSLDMGAHIIDLLNALEPVAMVAGKREFSFGEDVLSLRTYEAAFPVIASNIFDPITQENLDGVKDSLLIKVNGVTLGLLALLPPIAHQEYNLQRLEIQSPVDALKQRANELRSAGAQRIILTYSCCYRDYLNYFDELDQLLHDGVIDLALGKDEHLLLADHQLDQMHPAHIWITQGDEVAVVELTLESEAPDFLVSWKEDSMNAYPADAQVQTLVDGYIQRLESLLNEVIAEVKTEFATFQTDVRTQENPFGNLLADVIKAHADAEIAMVNGGYIRGERQYQIGEQLTRRDIMRELPFRDQVVLIDITGEQLLLALENGFSQIEEIKGRFPHVSGMQIEYNRNKPIGDRVVSVSVAGQPLFSQQTYRLATRQFIATGGDGFDMFGDLEPLRYAGQSSRLIADILIDAIQQSKQIAPHNEGRLIDLSLP
ncbi:MAG: bifunctional metallophosphatase/5'-nucleotidase [Oceanospirillales bacterium]|nr:MAG: bifunctional metallophosphatase/5'-nucleotidase [Oceanospirillales bacterium]